MIQEWKWLNEAQNPVAITCASDLHADNTVLLNLQQSWQVYIILTQYLLPVDNLAFQSSASKWGPT